ncbi:sugar transferase [Telluribacter sp.]|uniref:sugar transferase n=1 Tax=Telluribacter sp. TaxID=1978767 RepID=UPI002E12C927|nr:sugar transferase [Telluribacter sp.]
MCSKSILYIFSDAAKSKLDIQKVHEVRHYIGTIKGFKEVNIIEQKFNKGLANSIIDGVSTVLDIYKKVIVLEDDLIVSNDFLKFMNDSLDLYENNHMIHSISGFRFPIQLPGSYIDNVYLLSRSCSYGWGTWSNRWFEARWDLNYFYGFFIDITQRKSFEKGGEDLTLMLLKQNLNLHDSWAIRWDYNRFLSKSYTLYPVEPKVITVGNDGSGTNDSKYSVHNSYLSNKQVVLKYNVMPNDGLNYSLMAHFKLSFLKKIYYTTLTLKYFIGLWMSKSISKKDILINMLQVFFPKSGKK